MKVQDVYMENNIWQQRLMKEMLKESYGSLWIRDRKSQLRLKITVCRLQTLFSCKMYSHDSYLNSDEGKMFPVSSSRVEDDGEQRKCLFTVIHENRQHMLK